jgi:hypothetical protein
MTNRITQITWFIFLPILLLFLAGCSKEPGPPPALAVEQIPAELEKAFKQAKQETKDVVGKLNSGLQNKDYADAYDAVQALGNIPDTTKEQRMLVSRAMLTIYGLLQTAQANGDDRAAAAIRYHQMTK